MEPRMSKIDEELEIQALRRVISAYLNYPSAAEDDIRRWERSYSKLSAAHKALLPHIPRKFEDLKRCVKTNSYFILNMLQAFEPPFEMGDGGASSEFEDSEQIEHDVHVHEPIANAVRGAETTIEQFSYKNPTRDSSIPSTNSNKRQAVESICNDSHSDTSRKETGAFGTGRGPLRSVDDWASILSEAQSKDHVQSLSGTGGLVCEDASREICDNGHSMGSDVDPANMMTHARIGIDMSHPCYQLRVPSADVDKVRCIIRNIVRDWGEEGALEREQCYKPILKELHRLFPDRSHTRPSPTCLVPGAGLGRLACEISRLGFITQGNEFSYYMLMCSSFILNQTEEALEWTLHPWIHSNCNSLSDADQLRAVCIPDLHPGSAGITEGFSMCAGDFVEVYSHSSQAGAWDAIVSCFFIDTAHNVVEYLQVIARALKPGGVWINLGPLLYHFAESYCQEEEMSLELSLEDVKKVASQLGLILKTERMIETTYTANCRSMMQNRYTAAFWTMVKESQPVDNVTLSAIGNDATLIVQMGSK